MSAEKDWPAELEGRSDIGGGKWARKAEQEKSAAPQHHSFQ
jgi:hypothetical protein